MVDLYRLVMEDLTFRKWFIKEYRTLTGKSHKCSLRTMVYNLIHNYGLTPDYIYRRVIRPRSIN